MGVTTASDTTITLASGTGWPSPTGGQLSFGVLNPATATESKFTYTGRAGAVLSGVTFSADGTTAAATYAIGVAVRHVFSAQEAGEANDAVRYTIGLIQAAGDFIYGSAANVFSRLAKGTAFQGLQMNSGATAPAWGATARSTLTAAGDILYASAANTLARLAKGTDGQVLTLAAGIPSWGAAAGGSSTFSGCRLTKSAAQTIATATQAAVSFDGESVDVGGWHDSVTNNSRITVPAGKDGYLRLFGALVWNNPAAAGQRYAEIKKNGTTFIVEAFSPGVSGLYTTVPVQDTVAVVAGDYFELFGFQDSGGNANVNGTAGTTGTIFGCQFLGT